jgi:hypothetical protein
MSLNFCHVLRNLSINDDNIKFFQIKINRRHRKLLNFFDAPIDRFYKKIAFYT